MPARGSKHLFATVVASAATLLLAASAAPAQDKTFELKLSHWVPPTHPLQKAMEEWGASIEKASNGTIKSKVFPSQQLGKAFDHYDMARDGIADFTYVNPGYQPGRFPIISAGELPFLVGDAKGGIRAVDAWYRKYAPTEMKDVKYCFSFILDPLTWHSSKKKIVVPSDIKGMKVRPSQATVAAWVTLLGGTNVQASATEVRDVMEKGVAEAVTFPWGSVPLLGVDKVTKYHMDAPLHTVTFQWLIVRDPDLEDQVTAVHAVADELQSRGFGSQLLAAAFRFGDEQHPTYWIYGFKTGTFWPFVPTGEKQGRDNARELELKAKLEPELPIEPDLSRWLALFDAPI